MNWSRPLFVCVFFLCFSLQVTAIARSAESGDQHQWCHGLAVWPQQASDLPPDPSVVFGRLDNGFRYLLMKNQEPKGRVAIYLDVQAGSLVETDEQRGVAHFLEHMVFNGSTHFPPGALVDYFQSIGMSFGGDTNAHTSFDETVYRILLPGASRQELEKGLLVMADYARGALLLESEIERERGVILSEKRARDSAEYRAQEASLAFTMRGTRIPERMPIGVLETLNKVDRSLMKSYYDAWYRPEMMILVLVGDFDPILAESLVKERFAQIRGEKKRPDCQQWGGVAHVGTDFFYQFEPEMGHTRVTIETVWNEPESVDSLARQTARIHGEAADRILQHRLDRLLETSDSPFSRSQIHSGVFLRRIGYGAISARTSPDKWQAALTALEQELRGALEYGFTEPEVERVRKEMLAELDAAVLTARTRDSQKLAAHIVRTLNNNQVLMSPQQELEIFAPVVSKFKAEDLRAALQRVWNQKARLMAVVGNTELSGQEPRTQIRKVYEQAATRKLALPTTGTELVFPYLHLVADDGETRQEPILDGQGEKITLANGVVVNLKPTTFKENEVELVASFGFGKCSEPRPGLALLAERVMNESGTGRLTRTQLERVLSGSTVKLDFKVGEASCMWRGSAVNRDLELMFQLLQTRLADQVAREDATALAMQGFKQMYDQMASDVNGVMQLSGESFLAGGHPSFGLPPWSEFSRLQAEQIQAWMDQEVTSGGLEVSVVGDIDRRQVRELARTYLASLPRQKPSEMEEKRIAFPAGQTLRLHAPSSIDKAMLVVAWPTDDFWNIERTRGLYLLTEIFADRLRKVIREKLGDAYSPQALNQPSRTYAGYGVLRTQLIVDPARIESIHEEVVRVAHDLWSSGVTWEELERARAPLLTSLKDMVRTNGYWLHSVLSLSSRHPQQLQWPATIVSGFASISREQLTALAREYLDPGKAATVMVVPGKQG